MSRIRPCSRRSDRRLERCKASWSKTMPAKLDSQTFGHHSNNFRPAIVVEIFRRFAVKDLIGQLGENVRLKNHFGVTTKAQCSTRLAAKWNEFYDRRNETVHSLGGRRRASRSTPSISYNRIHGAQRRSVKGRFCARGV